MALPRIDTLLATDSEMQPVVAKARQINALAILCKEFLPPELASQVQPANLQGDKLVILAANSAAAAKLKLLSGSLSDFLAKRGAKPQIQRRRGAFPSAFRKALSLLCQSFIPRSASRRRARR